MNTYTGGCQCGAIRFRATGVPQDSSICHCRMCQKAFGAFYAPLVSVGHAKLEWTRGQPKRFQSSNFAFRSFCGDCGTPLGYEAPDGIGLAIGAFDKPEEIAPTCQWGVEAKLPYVDGIPTLPGETTLDDPEAASFIHDIVSYQHPDYDTDQWPPEDRK